MTKLTLNEILEELALKLCVFCKLPEDSDPDCEAIERAKAKVKSWAIGKLAEKEEEVSFSVNAVRGYGERTIGHNEAIDISKKNIEEG